jgi:hypothetical protein
MTTISLNSVTLDDDLYWDEEYSYASSAQSVLHTILGNVIVQTTPLSGGYEIVLSTKNEEGGYVGHFTRAQIEGFKSLEQSGTLVDFVFDSETHQVIVKSGGIQMEPLFPYTTKSASDKFIGSLVLLKV